MSDDITSLYQELKALNCVLQFVRSEESPFPPAVLNGSMNTWPTMKKDTETKNKQNDV